MCMTKTGWLVGKEHKQRKHDEVSRKETYCKAQKSVTSANASTTRNPTPAPPEPPQSVLAFEVCPKKIGLSDKSGS